MLILFSVTSFLFSLFYGIAFMTFRTEAALICANIYLASTFVLCGISYFYYKKSSP